MQFQTWQVPNRIVGAKAVIRPHCCADATYAPPYDFLSHLYSERPIWRIRD